MKKVYTKISILSILFITGILTNVNAQKPIKVLFIGNSFTYTNDLPTMFKGLCSAAGKSVITDEDANAGQYFSPSDPSGASPAHAASAVTYSKIRSQVWDYVVLQDNQGYFARYTNVIPSYVFPDNMKVRDSVRINQPCARVIWFAGWGPLGGYPSYLPNDNTTLELNRIDSNYQYMVNQYPAKKEIMAPFGKAWLNAMTALPSINLYYSDNTHPGIPGQLIDASVLYTTIFKQDPSAVNYIPPGFTAMGSQYTAAAAASLLNIGYTTTMTPYIYATHGLPSNTPTVIYSGGVLTTSGSYSSYQWYLNNVTISGATSASYTPTSNGSYMVIATSTSNGCAQNWSFPVAVTAVGIDENQMNNSIVRLYPNPITNASVIDLKDIKWEGGRIDITDLIGQTVQSKSLLSDKYFIQKNDFKSGMYIYTITDAQGNKFTGKISVL
jgi:hypothetical protein